MKNRKKAEVPKAIVNKRYGYVRQVGRASRYWTW